jgi:hypothetical protein
MIHGMLAIAAMVWQCRDQPDSEGCPNRFPILGFLIGERLPTFPPDRTDSHIYQIDPIITAQISCWSQSSWIKVVSGEFIARLTNLRKTRCRVRAYAMLYRIKEYNGM